VKINPKRISVFGRYYRWTTRPYPKYCFNKLDGTVVKTEELAKKVEWQPNFIHSLPDNIVPFFTTDILNLKLEFAKRYFSDRELATLSSLTNQELDTAINKIINNKDMYGYWSIYEEAVLTIDCLIWAKDNGLEPYID